MEPSPEGYCIRAYYNDKNYVDSAKFHVYKMNPEAPFYDVPSDSYYNDPVIWAVENGITNGVSDLLFGAEDSCLRAHVVTFLHRAAGNPAPTSTRNPFKDVKSTDFFYKPVLWAVENGITAGLDATHFGPSYGCNRAQVVTFLYRVYN